MKRKEKKTRREHDDEKEEEEEEEDGSRVEAGGRRRKRETRSRTIERESLIRTEHQSSQLYERTITSPDVSQLRDSLRRHSNARSAPRCTVHRSAYEYLRFFVMRASLKRTSRD